MDIHCKHCGEPWDTYELHDMPAPDKITIYPAKTYQELIADIPELVPGTACGCAQCCTDDPDTCPEDCDGCHEDEGGFSWYRCECCGDPRGGDRYAAHDHKGNHYEVCAPCLIYWANGEEPEEDHFTGWNEPEEGRDEFQKYSYKDAAERFARLGCAAFEDPSPDAQPCDRQPCCSPERLEAIGILSELASPDDIDGAASDQEALLPPS